MSGLSEIIDWVESEVILDPTNDVRGEFEDLSKMFEKRGRLPLSDILQEQEGEFLEFLESKQRDDNIEEPDEELEGLERRLVDLERELERVSRSFRTEFGQIIRKVGDLVLPDVGSTSR